MGYWILQAETLLQAMPAQSLDQQCPYQALPKKAAIECGFSGHSIAAQGNHTHKEMPNPEDLQDVIFSFIACLFTVDYSLLSGVVQTMTQSQNLHAVLPPGKISCAHSIILCPHSTDG